jgi:hypothetical protein
VRVRARGVCLAALAVWLFQGPAATAHTGVGVVVDSRANVFYTDLEQVWRIALLVVWRPAPLAPCAAGDIAHHHGDATHRISRTERRHSARRAATGSILVARRAGT